MPVIHPNGFHLTYFISFIGEQFFFSYFADTVCSVLVTSVNRLRLKLKVNILPNKQSGLDSCAVIKNYIYFIVRI